MSSKAKRLLWMHFTPSREYWGSTLAIWRFSTPCRRHMRTATFVAWLALYGSDAELAGAFLINLPAWGANCGRMHKALHEKYGIAPSALGFFDLFANMPSFEQEALGIIQNGLDRGVPARLIHLAARILQSYELMYWDAMVGAACPSSCARKWPEFGRRNINTRLCEVLATER